MTDVLSDRTETGSRDGQHTQDASPVQQYNEHQYVEAVSKSSLVVLNLLTDGDNARAQLLSLNIKDIVILCQ